MAFRFINKQTNWASSIPHFQCISPLGDTLKKLQYTANDLVGMKQLKTKHRAPINYFCMQIVM